MVVRDLLGPAEGPEEELGQHEDHVYTRYLVGMLAPVNSEVAAEELDELATAEGDEGEDGKAETGVPAGNAFYPFYMGLSFVVDSDASTIVVEAEWGRYLRIKSDTQEKKDGNPANVWKREPVIAPPLEELLKKGNIAATTLHPDHPQLLLQGKIRATTSGWVATLFLVNMQGERKRRNEPKDEVWLFQPKLRVRGVDDQPIFVHRKGKQTDLSKMDPITREESETLEML